MTLLALDNRLINAAAPDGVEGARRFALEFLYFGIKEARACLFAGLFFAAVFLVPSDGALGLYKYDLLLLIAIAIQAWMLWAKLETLDEAKAICVFHALGFLMEVFKTSSAIGSWHYLGPGYTKLFGVPLFSGFMYAAVGSYMIQAWRLFSLRIRHHPPYWMATLVATAIYVNFFSHHFIPDMRWYIAVCVLGLYARTTVAFRPLDRERSMPLLAAFVLIGFFIWLAENVGTGLNLWRYSYQLGPWQAVDLGKWSSWSLLAIMTFTIVANLKHVKERVHVPD